MSFEQPDHTTDAFLAEVNNMAVVAIDELVAKIDGLQLMITGFHLENPVLRHICPDDIAPLLALRPQLERARKALSRDKRKTKAKPEVDGDNEAGAIDV
jgi:hypothetical protein